MASLTKRVAKTVMLPKFRPSPPKELVKRIIGFMSERLSTPFDTAVDVGCGSGKSTEALSPYFKNVIGLDSSDLRDNYAYKPGGLYNIIYSHGTAEHISCFDESVQLVTASQCAHWFNMRKFLSETERVLSPGGVLAIYGYSLPMCDRTMEEVNHVINELMNVTLASYMPNQSKTLYVDQYKTKEFESFLFNKEPVQRDESCHVEMTASISDLVDYIRNTATFQNYESNNGQNAANNLLRTFQERLMQIHGSQSPDDAELSIKFNFILLMGRKPY